MGPELLRKIKLGQLLGFFLIQFLAVFRLSSSSRSFFGAFLSVFFRRSSSSFFFSFSSKFFFLLLFQLSSKFFCLFLISSFQLEFSAPRGPHALTVSERSRVRTFGCFWSHLGRASEPEPEAKPKKSIFSGLRSPPITELVFLTNSNWKFSS